MFRTCITRTIVWTCGLRCILCRSNLASISSRTFGVYLTTSLTIPTNNNIMQKHNQQQQNKQQQTPQTLQYSTHCSCSTLPTMQYFFNNAILLQQCSTFSTMQYFFNNAVLLVQRSTFPAVLRQYSTVTAVLLLAQYGTVTRKVLKY